MLVEQYQKNGSQEVGCKKKGGRNERQREKGKREEG